MSATEYVITLLSILVGLALADLATSLHRAIRAGSTVRWHWLAIVFALIVLFTILDWWWSSYTSMTQVLSIGDFLIPMISLVLLFLLASVALPDAFPAEGVSLRDYYFATHRYAWSLFATYAALATVSVYLRGYGFSYSNLVAVAVMVALAIWRTPWLHNVLLPLILAQSIVAFFGNRLPLPG